MSASESVLSSLWNIVQFFFYILLYAEQHCILEKLVFLRQEASLDFANDRKIHG